MNHLYFFDKRSALVLLYFCVVFEFLLFNLAFILSQRKTKNLNQKAFLKLNKAVSLTEVKQICKCTTGFK